MICEITVIPLDKKPFVADYVVDKILRPSLRIGSPAIEVFVPSFVMYGGKGKKSMSFQDTIKMQFRTYGPEINGRIGVFSCVRDRYEIRVELQKEINWL
jgi:hypothetical protein